MRIGIDLDDTICRTTEMVNDKMKEYAKKKSLDVLDIMNDEDIKLDFFNEYLPDIYRNVKLKRNAKDVIRRLKNKGNQIFLITARTNSLVPSVKDVASITGAWLKDNGIEVDGIFSSAYGEDKAQIMKREKIDLMVDDDPYNYKMIVSRGGCCILFDDREKYDLKENYATDWLEVEKFINQFRG